MNDMRTVGKEKITAKIITELLINRNMTISTAESCTGGMLAAKLTENAGASKVFIEGFVTYSNEAKINRLNVKPETLEQYGAVSEQTAYEMAEGLCINTKTNIGISITGIAGPDGGTVEKPVGLVYVGLNINGRIIVNKLNLTGDRTEIRQKTVDKVLQFLYAELMN